MTRTTCSLAIVAGTLAVVQTHATQRGSLSPEAFVTISEEKYQQVMYIGPGLAPGSIRVLSRRNVQEFDASGKRLRTTPYPGELWRPFPASFQIDGPQQIVGLKSGFFSSWIDILDASAKRVRRIKSWQYGEPEVADVLGDGSREVLIRYEDGVRVLSETGRQLAFVKSPRYLYHFRTIQIPGAAKRAIAMWMWRDAKHGTDISVLRADGSQVAAWREHPSERFGVFSLDGEDERLWSAVADRFWERSATGAVLRTYVVAGMGNYRYVRGSALGGGKKVLVASAGGYQTGSLVCVFDARGPLLARDPVPAQVWALYVPDPTGHVFFVGSGELVLRYDAASLTRSGSP